MGANLAEMQLTSKFSKGIYFPLCIIDIYSKYTWVVPLNDKKNITITNASQKISGESGWIPNKICIDKGSEFYKWSMNSWLQDNDIEMIQNITKKNMLLLKNSLEPQKTKFTNVWLNTEKCLYQ